MKKVVSLVLSFTFIFTSTLPAHASGDQESIRIVSDYLKNGDVYWDSTWSVAQKAQQHQLNLAKTLDLFKSLREGLTCSENNLNDFELYYCNARSTYDQNQEFPTEAIIPTVIGWMLTHTLVHTASSNAVERNMIPRWYMTPYDRMVMSSPEKFFSYIRFYEDAQAFPRSDYAIDMIAMMNKKIDFNILDRKTTGFDIEISRMHNGEKQTLQVTKEILFRIFKETDVKPYGFDDVYVSKYFNGIFDFGIDYFIIPEHNKALSERIKAFKAELYTLASKRKLTERPDFSLHLVKWHKSQKYRVQAHLKIAGGFMILATVAGTLTYILTQKPMNTEDEFMAEHAATVTDLESLRIMIDTEMTIGARLALLHDEILAGVRQFRQLNKTTAEQ